MTQTLSICYMKEPHLLFAFFSALNWLSLSLHKARVVSEARDVRIVDLQVQSYIAIHKKCNFVKHTSQF